MDDNTTVTSAEALDGALSVDRYSRANNLVQLRAAHALASSCGYALWFLHLLGWAIPLGLIQLFPGQDAFLSVLAVAGAFLARWGALRCVQEAKQLEALIKLLI